MEFLYVKIAIFTPFSHADAVRKALAEAGAGHIGNYDFCSFSTQGVGRFRGLEGSKPFVGQLGKIEEVQEERIEVICQREKLDSVLASVKKVHPYEEPVIDIYSFLNRA